MTYQPIPTTTINGVSRATVVDTDLADLIKLLTSQIRILNLHLAIMTGEELVEDDVDDYVGETK